MDKPDWALRFLAQMCSQHCEELTEWLATSNSSRADAPRLAAARSLAISALPAGLAFELANEAKLFVRTRMPAMTDASTRPILLETILRLVRFRHAIEPLGGSSPERTTHSLGGRLMTGLSHLRKGGAPESPEMRARATSGVGELLAGFEHGLEQFAALFAQEADNTNTAAAHSTSSVAGISDVWTAADSEFMREKIASSVGSSGSGWRARAPESHEVDGAGAPSGAELATLLADLLEKSRERAECLSAKAARRTYVQRALEPGLLQALAALRGRWNGARGTLAR
eukprot:TRINITY_DN7135_c0_g1_i1.p1 TRINITY_DN7135_c0_g1~~TRINITY_DN7135_c0_g1_i1.p1  ORF type:complete len:285 (+),score=37.12 TRINITY_DN7135_c0_g1_i1:747-1601(+)